MNVDNSQQLKKPDGSFAPRTGIRGSARPRTEDHSIGKLEVKLGAQPFWAPYDVLATDYTSYAFVHSCTKIAGFKFDFAWILTREQLNKDDKDAKAILDSAKEHYSKIEGFDFDKEFQYTIQGEANGCDYSAW